MVALAITYVILGSSGQLVWPGFGLLLKEQGLLIHLGALLLVLMGSQFLAIWLCQIFEERWKSRDKTIAQLFSGLNVIPLILQVVAVKYGNVYCYYIAVALNPGFATVVSTIVTTMLRGQLGEKDRIVGFGWIVYATSLAAAGCVWLGFQAPMIVWSFTNAGLSVLIIVLLRYAEFGSGEPKKQQDETTVTATKAKACVWWRDPVTPIVAGNFCMLFILYCFSKLLPLAEVVDVKHVDNLLVMITLFSALMALNMRIYVNRHPYISGRRKVWIYRGTGIFGLILMMLSGGWWGVFIAVLLLFLTVVKSRRSSGRNSLNRMNNWLSTSNRSWMMIGSRMAMFVGLCLLLKSNGGWFVIGVCAALWAWGGTSNSLSDDASYQNAEKKVRSVTFSDMSWNLAGFLGGAYIWVTEVIHVSQRTALEWLKYPAGFSVICALLLWQLHKLPYRLDKLPEKKKWVKLVLAKLRRKRALTK